jgi:hypothetical protein
VPQTELLLIGGRSGVGKSTVAAEVHRQLSSYDVHHAWIEGDNLDMAYPVPWRQGHLLAEANLAAMWSNYRDHGYTRLIYVNTASVAGHVIAELTAAMGDDPRVTGVLLTSSDDVADERLAQREIGGGLSRARGRSREAAIGLEEEAPAEVTRLDTDGRTVVELAAEVIRLSGWRHE